MKREDMRLIEILILSADVRSKVLGVLDERGLDYAVSDDTEGSNASAVVSVPVPASAVEPIQESLDELAVDEHMYTVVENPEAVLSRRLDRPAERYDQVSGLGHQGIARSELHSTAADLLPDFTVYTLLTALSGVVATAGVLLESLAVLVGSMVIAPLIGPPMAMSVATVIDDDDLAVHSLKYQLAGGGVGLASATGFAALVRLTSTLGPTVRIEEVLRLSNHTAPSVLLVVVALCAGVAGAITLATSATVGLVGVMIAAALVPPIGVMGVAIAWDDPVTVLGSGAVVLVNVLSINLAAIITFWYLGYHPRSWVDLRKARTSMLIRVLVLAAMIALLSAFLAGLANAAVGPIAF